MEVMVAVGYIFLLLYAKVVFIYIFGDNQLD
jgi:hypothetical protein